MGLQGAARRSGSAHRRPGGHLALRSSGRETRAINPGPGSFRVLAWLGRLGVAGVEPLAVALGLSIRTTYSHVSRLETVGLVWRVPIRDGGGGAVAISPRGARRLRDDGLPAVAPKSQVPSTGEHSRAVSWVAANFDRRDGFTWLGPAELRDDRRVWRVQRDDGAGHMPDLGVIDSDGRRIAIEVELHSKSHDRLRAILRGYRLSAGPRRPRPGRLRDEQAERRRARTPAGLGDLPA